MEYIFAQGNNREITGKDKIFGISQLAKTAIARDGKENVVNATIGALLDDNGELIVLSSVVDILHSMSPADFAEYAPIAGTPEFLDVINQAAFGKHTPDGYIEACATPGGTGTIRNTVANYSKPGDLILTSNWYWSPYQVIASEIGRKVTTFEMFDETGNFNFKSFEDKISTILNNQNQIVILFNAPAHNPTGFSPSDSDWDEIIEILKRCAVSGKRITFFIDIAYIDFAGDSDKAREFLPKFGHMPDNILTICGFSASKGFTLYGMRTGAMLCITQNKEISEEFKRVTSYSSRGSWSNCPRAGQTAIARIFNDETLLKKVFDERMQYEKLLKDRCDTFRTASADAGLKTCPFNGGFFVTVPCENDDEVNSALCDENIFGIAIGGGIRIAVAAINEENCRRIPANIAAAIEKING